VREYVNGETLCFPFTYGDFWQDMDTLRDKNRLEELRSRGAPAWKVRA
jgi:hypothetical protein